jgi:hypothetical protein
LLARPAMPASAEIVDNLLIPEAYAAFTNPDLMQRRPNF